MWRACVVAAVLLEAVAARVDYCATNTFGGGPNSSWLQFTKELIPAEYAIENSFKSIHCCGKGYRSIEWFKDGVAYPWSTGVSNFILYPEAANQTLYTWRTGKPDRGNYTCRMRNETHTRQHTVRLQVDEKLPDSPKTTFAPTDQWVEVGVGVRLYCEALVGRVYLADAHNDIGWRRVLPNGTKTELGPPYEEIKTTREGEDIVGAYLLIQYMTTADYGQYVCTVRSNDISVTVPVTLHYIAPAQAEGGAPAVPWRVLVLAGVGACAALGSLAVLHARCTPRLVLAARIAHARATRATRQPHVLEKPFDVLVVFTGVDSELARGALLPTLGVKYHYRVRPLQLTTEPDTWYEQILGHTEQSRSLLCVLSPAQYSPPQLLSALRQLCALPLPPVVVLLQDIPKLKRETKDARGESLVSLLRRTRLIPWRHMQESAFWTALRLALPLPPPASALLASEPPRANKESGLDMSDMRSGARSGSLDALV